MTINLPMPYWEDTYEFVYWQRRKLTPEELFVLGIILYENEMFADQALINFCLQEMGLNNRYFEWLKTIILKLLEEEILIAKDYEAVSPEQWLMGEFSVNSKIEECLSQEKYFGFSKNKKCEEKRWFYRMDLSPGIADLKGQPPLAKWNDLNTNQENTNFRNLFQDSVAQQYGQSNGSISKIFDRFSLVKRSLEFYQQPVHLKFISENACIPLGTTDDHHLTILNQLPSNIQKLFFDQINAEIDKTVFLPDLQPVTVDSDGWKQIAFSDFATINQQLSQSKSIWQTLGVPNTKFCAYLNQQTREIYFVALKEKQIDLTFGDAEKVSFTVKWPVQQILTVQQPEFEQFAKLPSSPDDYLKLLNQMPTIICDQWRSKIVREWNDWPNIDQCRWFQIYFQLLDIANRQLFLQTQPWWQFLQGKDYLNFWKLYNQDITSVAKELKQTKWLSTEQNQFLKAIKFNYAQHQTLFNTDEEVELLRLLNLQTDQSKADLKRAENQIKADYLLGIIRSKISKNGNNNSNNHNNNNNKNNNNESKKNKKNKKKKKK